jgi:cyclopropane fatty-acyl-phospholipid synthase-like methyltransferase
MKLINFLNKFEVKNENIYFDEKSHKGYWSNLSKNENLKILEGLKSLSPKEVVLKEMPNLYDVIFSSQRAVAAELLDLKGHEIIVDLGCMWGGLTIPLAKQSKHVLGIDQTRESLVFSSERAKSENLKNISFLNANLRDIKLPTLFDAAIVNGVLEWIPETGEVDLNQFFKSKSAKSKTKNNPKVVQKKFLKNVYNSLNTDGKLFLAIENRYDYKYFLGVNDPHSQTLYTTILPKKLVSLYFRIFKKKEYNTWIYSFNETKKIIEEAGFKSVDVYSAWPDYHFPEQIFKYGCLDGTFVLPTIRRNGKIKFKLLVKRFFETLLFKILKLDFFAPAIIIIAKK